MQKIFEGKVAVVTGASRGLGRAVAVMLGGMGAQVVCLARSAAGLEETDDLIRSAGGPAATLIPGDLTDFDKLDALGPALYGKFGRVDLLAACAGILGPLTPAAQLTPEKLDAVMKVNFTANYHVIRTLDPLLRAGPAGRAVFVSTGPNTVKGRAYWGAYVAAKAALDSLVRSYAAEVAQTNLKVNLFRPGLVDTAMLKEAYPGGSDDRDIRSPEDAAPHMLPLLQEDCAQSGGEVAI